MSHASQESLLVNILKYDFRVNHLYSENHGLVIINNGGDINYLIECLFDLI